MRVLSLGSFVLFSLLEAAHLATGGKLLSFGGLLLAVLAAGSLVASLLHVGDRYRIDENGIGYANPLMARIGFVLDRSVAWSEIRSVRAHRGLRFGVHEEHPSALFLEIEGGRRFVIDSVEDFDEIHRVIAAHLAPDTCDLPQRLDSRLA